MPRVSGQDAPEVEDEEPGGRARHLLTTNGAVLLGLWGLAIAQPILDLFGRNAAYFVVGRLTKVEIVLFGLIVTFALPAALLLIELVLYRVSTRVGRVFHLICVGVLGGLLGATLARHVLADADVAMIVAAPLVAGLVVLGVSRVPAVELGLRYLAAAPVLFLGAFLLSSGASRVLFDRPAEAVSGVKVGSHAPVVFLQMDEFALASLLAADGSVNAAMFPNFARLAGRSTWYRTGRSVSEYTTFSVPSTASGVLPESDSLPTSSDYPRNLFTLLGGSYAMNVRESPTTLCPESLCPESAGDTSVNHLLTAVTDAGVVYGRAALPPSLRESLPRVDGRWGSFIDGADAPTAASRASQQAETYVGPEQEGADLERWVSRIPGGASTLSYAHVLLPHQVWLMGPDGRPAGEPGPIYGLSDEGVWGDDPVQARLGMQVYLLQVQYVDRLLGELIDRLEAVGSWDDALVVVAADHGVAFTPGHPYRARDEATLHEIFNVPFFIKYPGQTEGVVDDSSALTIDILPTIVDALDIETDWEFDGQSLLAPEGERADKPARDEELTGVSPQFEGVLEVVARDHDWLPALDGELGVAGVEPYLDLLGRPVTGLDVHDSTVNRWWSYVPVENYDTDAAIVPLVQVGYLLDVSGPPPEAGLMVVNGTVAGVAQDFTCDGTECRFRGVIDRRLLADRDNTMELLIPDPGQPRRFGRVTAVPGPSAEPTGG